MAAENVPIKMLWRGNRREGHFVGRAEDFSKEIIDTLLAGPPPGKEYIISYLGRYGPPNAVLQTVDADTINQAARGHSIVDAWRCSRCDAISLKRHADAHFTSASCIDVERKAALEAAGYTPAIYFKEVQVQVPAWNWDHITGQNTRTTIAQAAWLSNGLQSILINQFGCEEVHGAPWVSKEMRDTIIAWLKAREDGVKHDSLPKTLEKAGFKRYPKALRSASPTKCFICGGDAAPGNSLMLADKQYGLCSTDAPKFMVAMDEVLEKMK